MQRAQQWLYINAGFSTLCASISLLANQSLQTIFQFNNPYVFPSLGVGLLLFVGQLLWVTWHKPIKKSSVISISIMDGIWVLLSGILILFRLFQLSNSGYLIVAIVAVFVGLFGYQQFKSVRHA